MKRQATLILILLLCVGMLGVGAAEQAERQPLGKLTRLGASEELLNAKVDEGLIALPLFSGFKYFDAYNSMIAALESGSIAAINVDEYMVGYLLSRSEAFAPFQKPGGL